MSSLSVLIPYYGSDPWREKLFSWLLSRCITILPDAEIVIGEGDGRGAARNDAFSKSTGQFLLIADADTLFHVGQVGAAVERIARHGGWVIPYGPEDYYNLSASATSRVLAGRAGDDVSRPTDEDDWEFKLTSWAGLLVMPREAFEAVGGYDTRFRDWGYEDSAFTAAMDTLWAPHHRLEGEYCLHLWHPVSEADRFGQPHIDENRLVYREYERARGARHLMAEVVNRRGA